MIKLRTYLAAAAAFAALAPAAYAQQSGFAGTWVVDASRSDSALQVEKAAPVTLVISQTPTVLTIERREGAGSRIVNYKTDGSETVSSQKGDTATGHLKREGSKLITETVYDMRGFPLTQTQIHTLSSDGRELTVESAMKVEHGYEGKDLDPLQASPNYSKGTDIYRRQ